MFQRRKFITPVLFRARQTTKPAPMAGFIVNHIASATPVPQKYVTYKPPVIVKGKRWYVQYWHLVPVELREKYNKQYLRFRVFEEINKYRTHEYAQLLRDAIEIALEDGWSPFEDELAALTIKAVPMEWSLNFGLDQFLSHCREKKLRKKTIESYTTTINYLREYFYKDNRIFKPLSSFEKKDFKGMLSHYGKLFKWEATTYNGKVSNLGIIFNWFVEEEQLVRSPVSGIETREATVNRHRYYDDLTAGKLKEMISKNNPYLYSFIEFIYYTATRPKSEARLLQIKHLLFDRKLIHIPGNVSKNKTGDYIPMSEELAMVLQHLRNMDPELYIWGPRGPAKKPAGQNHFSVNFKPYKEKLGLGPEYSIYGFKHLRCIHLAQAGANPYDIMRLFRHSSLEQTQIYMKDLGLTDYSDLLKKGRKF